MEKKQGWQNTHWVEDSDPEPAWNSCHRGEEQETCSTPQEAVQTAAAAAEETCSSLLLIIEGRFKLRRQLHTVTDGWRKIKIFVSIWGQKQSWLPYVPDEERYQLADLLENARFCQRLQMLSICTACDLAFHSWNQRKGLYVFPTHARTQGSSNRKGHKLVKDRLWYIYAMEYYTPMVISEYH